ncbi:MAG: AsnC family transcriptional regulator [Muricauda sp.]|nr:MULTISPECIES: Lrp/AsnC family transcriptional regulator [unclassified Allomuricauda]MAU14975.1 AsnC family transcriptional regulator [Allomuricauda sp.]|tara:strand:+ start:23428 stop:23889 length:462 start_codon:yes stop_codon:yes gene_type:complete
MDNLDIKILQILQKNNLVPQRDIGETIGLSAPAVQRRIKRMRETGIIKKDVSVIDKDAIGSYVTILVEVFLDRENKGATQSIRKELESVPEVQQCFYVSGESDFFLIVVVPSMKAYEMLTRRIFLENENIRRFRTIVAMDTIKSSLEIPLEPI